MRSLLICHSLGWLQNFTLHTFFFWKINFELIHIFRGEQFMVISNCIIIALYKILLTFFQPFTCTYLSLSFVKHNLRLSPWARSTVFWHHLNKHSMLGMSPLPLSTKGTDAGCRVYFCPTRFGFALLVTAGYLGIPFADSHFPFLLCIMHIQHCLVFSTVRVWIPEQYARLVCQYSCELTSFPVLSAHVFYSFSFFPCTSPMMIFCLSVPQLPFESLMIHFL